MDWRNYQFWRKKLRRVDETTAEFDLLVQRTKQRIVLGEQIRECFRLFERSSTRSKKVPERENFTRNPSDIQ
jgi:predicted RNase H-like nuclease (RuvC/YqgF family)